MSAGAPQVNRTDPAMAQSPDQRRKNVRLGLALASVAIMFLAGFVAKALLFGL